MTRPDALDQLAEAIAVVELAPATLGRFGQLENDRERGVASPAASGLLGPLAHHGEGALDRDRRVVAARW